MKVRYCSSECTAAAELKKNRFNALFNFSIAILTLLYALFSGQSLLVMGPVLFLPMIFFVLGGYSLHLVRVGHRYQNLRNKFLETEGMGPEWPYRCVWCGKEDVENWVFDGVMRPYCSLTCRSTESKGWNACLTPIVFSAAGFFYLISLYSPYYSLPLHLFSITFVAYGVYLMYSAILGVRAGSRKDLYMRDSSMDSTRAE